MTERELKTAAKSPSGGYFFCGEEDYLKEHYTSVIRRTVIADESIAVFNEVILGDDDFTADALLSAIAAPPLMSEQKLVRVRLTSYKAIPERERSALDKVYASLGEYPGAVLVISVAPGGFDPGTERRPSTAFKAISKHLSAVDFPLQSEAKLAQWLTRHFSGASLGTESEAAHLMVALCGRSMHRLRGEADKLIAAAKSSGVGTVSAALVGEIVSHSPEEDAFMLANSILGGDRAAALTCLSRAKRRGENPVRLLASVTSSFCDMATVAHLAAEGADRRAISETMKMHEYRVGLYMKAVSGVSADALDRAGSMCAEADMKRKTTPLGYIPLERLICSVGIRR